MKQRKIVTLEIETCDEAWSPDKYIGDLDENTRIWGIVALTDIPHVSKDQEDLYYIDIFKKALVRHVKDLLRGDSTQAD